MLAKGGEVNIPYEVQAVLNWFERNGYVASVAGGAARNLQFGAKVNDWDIVVESGGLCHAGAFELSEDLCHEFHKRWPLSTVQVTQAYDSAATDFDERWLALSQLEFLENNVSVDVLISTYPTIRETLEHFDSNVNQCYLSRETGNVYYPFGLPDALLFLKPITVARYVRLVDIAKEIGLPVKGQAVITDLDTLPKREDPTEDIAW
ncbi:tRNA nucleotidyltransferase/poly(A) polymerase [Escherichia phage vB_EcoP_LHP]